MARAAASKEYGAFIGGLITEASPLTYPENASLNEDNFILLRNGSRRRRLGFDYEEGHAFTDTGIVTTTGASYAISVHRWDNIKEDANLALAVVQIGLDLYFYDLYADSISASIRNGGVPLSLPASSATPTIPIDVTNINGILLVATGSKFIHILEYDAANDIVTRKQDTLKVRDIWGVDDGLEVETRPVSLSSAHKYNLLNQGWSVNNINTFKTKVGAYPSNADIVYFGKDAADDQKFNAELIARQTFGSTPAAKGRYIIDAFDRGVGRAGASGQTSFSYGLPFSFTIAYSAFENLFASLGVTAATAGLPQDRTTSGLTTVATYAGRVFYSGAESQVVDGDIKSPQYGGYVFFSQVAENTSNLFKCYQDADPSSEHISDLVDTDGGTIKIPEAGKVFKLLAVSDGILVFAKNGVWKIDGADSGFSATNFRVVKLSNNGAVNRDSVVQAGSNVLYWDISGIYALVVDPASGQLTSQNITERTIQTFYNRIPEAAKKTAKAVFDSAARQVRWLFNGSEEYDGIQYPSSYNKELVYDLVLSAFYPVTISSLPVNSPVIAGYLPVPGIVSIDDSLQVVIGADNVVVGGANLVIVDRTISESIDRSIKYLVIKNSPTVQFTFGIYRNATFKDWETEDGTGVDAPAFLITGYDLFGDSYRDKQATYIIVHMLRTETGFQDIGGELEAINPSSCLVQAQWGWSNSQNSGRWSTEFQAYRLKRNYIPLGIGDNFDYGFKVISTKSKIRGYGPALSLQFRTEPMKDCQLLGWALPVTGEQQV